MAKTILITGATDGIGLATAKSLHQMGHTILLHGRNPEKLAHAKDELGTNEANVITLCADLSDLNQVKKLVAQVHEKVSHIDVLMNNAGILNAPISRTDAGLDVRFVVNTIAPFVLTQGLLPLMDNQSRVINLSSAAQAPVNLERLNGEIEYSDDMVAYA